MLIQKSSEKFEYLSDKTPFLQPEEINSIPSQKSSEKFEYLSDKTPFLQKEDNISQINTTSVFGLGNFPNFPQNG